MASYGMSVPYANKIGNSPAVPVNDNWCTMPDPAACTSVTFNDCSPSSTGDLPNPIQVRGLSLCPPSGNGPPRTCNAIQTPGAPITG